MTDTVKLIPSKGAATNSIFTSNQNGIITIGRHPNNDLQFLDTRISRFHLNLEVKFPSVTLIPGGSNFTYIIRQGKSPITLPPKDTVSEEQRVILKDQDIIRFAFPDEEYCVGEFKVEILLAPRCKICGTILDENSIRQFCLSCFQQQNKDSNIIQTTRSSYSYPNVEPSEMVTQAFQEETLATIPLDEDDNSDTAVSPTPQRATSSFPNSSFLLGEELDKNNTGTTYRVKMTASDRFLAFKEIKVDETDNTAMQILRRELRITKQLSHVNILRFYGAGKFIPGLGWGTLSEYCSEGNLQTYINGRILSEREALIIAIQIFRALDYAHSFPIYTLPQELREGHGNGIVHGNINPTTVLLQEQNGKLFIKLAEFGIEKAFRTPAVSGFKAADFKPNSITTTSYFMSKEQFFHPSQIRPSDDIFSAMAVLYYMLTGEYVRSYQNDSFAFFNGKIRPIRQLRPNLSCSLANLIDAVLADAAHPKITTQKVRMLLEKYYGELN